MLDNIGMRKTEYTSLFIGLSPVTPIQGRGSEQFQTHPFLRSMTDE